jgi:hypothetical protein
MPTTPFGARVHADRSIAIGTSTPRKESSLALWQLTKWLGWISSSTGAFSLQMACA